jgi:hypothetical protein
LLLVVVTDRYDSNFGNVELEQQPRPEPAKLAIAAPAVAARAIVDFNRAYWKLLLRMYGWGRTA